ncbi:ribosome maturation factor RimM [Natronospira bacteriovora]|uniref:Ribosome maturation factor RimM n=1 Tax=Natronospira bacteriovora TaxID=3069753 RepID=A0ABU0W4A9_9GAMM|nr:ribosome maturation factor RimM [Natronospira sp. AB-CW4]MDQ2068854.1 ribosome maturation factor RimM [Natronospira sp. AB-CW4]
MVTLGRISGLFGVKGWVKVYSHARPRESIVDFDTWYLRHRGEWQPFRVLEGRKHGKGVVARLEGIEDRDQAAALIQRDIAIPRETMPATQADEFYWVDLIGLSVRNLEGVEFGEVTGLLETGANDVMVVQGDRERLLPFVQGQFVKSVDLEVGLILVDWDPDF